ncbi:MAG: noncanonical pyrimidine nucleotidase, YjjG family [Ruminococcaceae bacterium]|nr:noncanonical pyrimidine nucleotidase, YjjG family [Oscillospiraceae bacterium]
MPRFKTLLFDADNTLFDFTSAEKMAITQTLQCFDIVPTSPLIAAYSRINDVMWHRLERGEITKAALRTARFEEFCREFGFSCDVTQMASTYLEALSAQTMLIDGALDVCRTLSGACRLYIVTNGIKSVQTRRFSASALKDFFSGVFISEEIGFEKPHRSYFEAVARQIEGFAPQSTLIIGDSLSSDILGGINAGLSTCWFNPEGKKAPEGLTIDFEIAALHELLPLVL